MLSNIQLAAPTYKRLLNMPVYHEMLQDVKIIIIKRTKSYTYVTHVQDKLFP